MTDKKETTKPITITQAAENAAHQPEAAERRSCGPVGEQAALTPGPLVNVPAQKVTPMIMMQSALAQGATPEQMERLWDLHCKVEAAEAKKAYVIAMTAFKANPPIIEKDVHVKYENKDGTFTEYDHASLANVVDTITQALGEHGFSHKWDVIQPEGGQIVVTCVITHKKGHSESVPMSSSRDDSGGKNNIQGLASAVTYLQRYTLLSAVGAATKGMDDDGRTAEPEEAIELISEDQDNELDALISENELNRERFTSWLKAELNCNMLSKVPAKHFDKVKRKINATIKAKKGGSNVTD